MVPSEERLALVLSNSDYGQSQLLRLPGARQDARSIAQELVRLPGFAESVCFAENLSRRDMIIQLTEFQEKILQADNAVGLALLYFAGHAGSSSRGAQYLIGRGFEDMGGLWDSALDEYGVKLTDVIQFLANSRRAVVIIDGCRDSKANTCGQQVYVDDVGTAIVAFSCGYGGLALDRYSDGKGYAYHILENLFDEKKSIFQALENVRQATAQASNSRQLPQILVQVPHLYEKYHIAKENGGLSASGPATANYQQHQDEIARLFEVAQETEGLHRPYKSALERRQLFERELIEKLQMGKETISYQGQTYVVTVSQQNIPVATEDFKQSLKEAEGMCSSCRQIAAPLFGKRRRHKKCIKVSQNKRPHSAGGSSSSSFAQYPHEQPILCDHL